MREGWFRGDVIMVGTSLKASRFPSEFCQEAPDAMDCSVSDRLPGRSVGEVLEEEEEEEEEEASLRLRVASRYKM